MASRIFKQEMKTKLDLFLAAIILFSFIAFIGYTLAFAKDENGVGDGLIVNFLADYLLFLFPLLLIKGVSSTPMFMLIAVALNIFIYSFLLLALLKRLIPKIRSYNPYNGIVYVTNSILAIGCIYFIYLIIRYG